MEKKRSRGVIIFGLILSGLGLFIFLGHSIFLILLFHNDAPLIKILAFAAKFYQSLRNSGVPLLELGGYLNSFAKTVYMEYPFLVLISFIIMPLLGFLILMGGIGILRLKEGWRKSAMITFALYMFTKFSAGIYPKLYFLYTVITGKIINSQSKDVDLRIKELTNIISSLLLKDLLHSVFWACLVIFFFTRPKVKAQFK